MRLFDVSKHNRDILPYANSSLQIYTVFYHNTEKREVVKKYEHSFLHFPRFHFVINPTPEDLAFLDVLGIIYEEYVEYTCKVLAPAIERCLREDTDTPL